MGKEKMKMYVAKFCASKPTPQKNDSRCRFVTLGKEFFLNTKIAASSASSSDHGEHVKVKQPRDWSPIFIKQT
jgi:hypothetical protein